MSPIYAMTDHRWVESCVSQFITHDSNCNHGTFIGSFSGAYVVLTVDGML